MPGLEVVVVVLAAVLTMTCLARRLCWNEPVMLVAGGCLIGLIPDFRGPALAPEVVLLLFLPPLLYWESLTTSLREIRTNVRGIVLLATGLVLATAAAVASVGHALGLSWPLAFVLGAVVAPTDAIAVATVARGLPRRIRTILRAESLINDGTALTLYAVVVGVAVEGLSVTWTDTAVRFLLAYAGGAGIGCGCAAVVVALRRRLRDRSVENALGVLTPFATYLPAQVLGVSGVLAVVTCGLILSQAGPKVISAGSRVQIISFWEVSTSSTRPRPDTRVCCAVTSTSRSPSTTTGSPEGDDFRTVLGLVAHGLGIALLPALALTGPVNGIVARPITEEPLVRFLYSCRVDTSRVPTIVARLEACLAASAGDLPESG